MIDHEVPPADRTVPQPGVTAVPCAPTPRQHPSAADSIRFATTALCMGLLCLGVLWRLIDLDYPRTFSFDEHHFVSNARNYIAHRADWNDHPPLGKLVLVPAMLVFGDRGLGWRLSSALLGLAMVGLAGLFTAKIFDDKRAGLFAATFLAIDGFFISYARSALIDNPLTACMYAALVLMLWARSLRWFAVAGICVGLAVASKWTGVCVLLLAPMLLRRSGKSMWHVLWMFALASLVYGGIGTAALYLTRQPISMAGMMRSNWALLQHHAGFTAWDNGASSKWYTWPFLIHPIITHFERLGGDLVRASSTIGNPLLWFATTAVMLVTLARLVVAAIRGVRDRVGAWGAAELCSARTIAGRYGNPPRVSILNDPTALALATMLALIVPFVATHRQSYIFHYLGAYGVGLGLLASRLARLEKRAPRGALAFLLVAACVSMLYLPLWLASPQTMHAFLLRLPFPGWR
jgi:dolichyl-phosphate-mannose--protein O-mannosyl transferase